MSAGRVGAAVRVLALPAVVLPLWEALPRIGLIPTYVLPPFSAVFAEFWATKIDVAQHFGVTMLEAAVGLVVAVAAAYAVSGAFVRWNWLKSLGYPWVIVLQAFPIIVYAPIIYIKFGSGMAGKAVAAFIISFFPLVIAATRGLESMPKQALDLFASLGTSSWQMLFRLQLPSSVTIVLPALRISATLAVVGATVCEFLGADAGLGFHMLQGLVYLNPARVYVGALGASVLSMALVVLIVLIERRFLSKYTLGQSTAGG